MKCSSTYNDQSRQTGGALSKNFNGQDAWPFLQATLENFRPVNS